MREFIKRKINFWLYPASSSQELILDRRRIYILPNKAGLAFGFILICIFVTAINYGINLGYALEFILISCAWLGILFTFLNIAGLGLTTSSSPAVFAGDLAHFAIQLNNRSKNARYAIAIGFQPSAMQLVDIPAQSSHNLTLGTRTTQRGWIACPRIRVQTTFPVGLMRAWSYWQTAQQILVYPTPEINPPPLPFVSENTNDTNAELIAGNDEFSGVRPYQSGDSLKLLAWRQIARQSGDSHEHLISKHFEGGQRRICLLDYASMPPQLDVEQKLSRLCAWLLAAEREQVSYAFKLGKTELSYNSGEDHQRSCLIALALFGNEASQ